MGCRACSWLHLILIATFAAASASVVGAQTPRSTESPEAAEPSAEKTALEREYDRLAQVLNTGNRLERREAARTLMLVRPNDVVDAETRKMIARGFRAVAFEDRLMIKEGVSGLVIWGGKYSVPVLIQLMEEQTVRVPEEIFDALGVLRDPQGAEAVTNYLGNTHNHAAAVGSLRMMGSAAEDALIKVAPSNNAKVSLVAVALLGEVGSEKSLPTLQRAMRSRNPEIRRAAQEGAAQIRIRERSGESVEEGLDIDPSSLFAPRTGSPIDLLALKDNAANTTRAARRPTPSNASAEANANRVIIPGDWSRVKELSHGAAGVQRTVPADPLRQGVDDNWRPRPIQLADRANGDERPIAIEIAGGLSPIAVIIHSGGRRAAAARLEVVDLRDGESISSTGIVAADSQSCALSPGGKRLLIVSKGSGVDRYARFEVWNLGGEEPALKESWYPYPDGGVHEVNIEWADWINEEQFLTLNASGSLVLWDVDGRAAVYRLDSPFAKSVTLSPGREYFLYLAAANQSGVYRANDGQLMARPQDSYLGAGTPVIHPEGHRLATVERGKVAVWDWSTGKRLLGFHFQNLGAATR